MDSRALYERPNGGLDMLPSLDGSFAGVFCVGYHAMAGTLNGFLDHTQSSASWYNYFLNGRLKTLTTKNGGGQTVESHALDYLSGGVYVDGNRAKDFVTLVYNTL